jgi:flagellar biosynthesis/type III secretory pathway M-ring protein FliF/YscJ
VTCGEINVMELCSIAESSPFPSLLIDCEWNGDKGCVKKSATKDSPPSRTWVIILIVCLVVGIAIIAVVVIIIVVVVLRRRKKGEEDIEVVPLRKAPEMPEIIESEDGEKDVEVIPQKKEKEAEMPKINEDEDEEKGSHEVVILQLEQVENSESVRVDPHDGKMDGE